MHKIYWISGTWTNDQVKLLSDYGIQSIVGFDVLKIPDKIKDFQILLDSLSTVNDFYFDEYAIIFDKNEISEANSFMFWDKSKRRGFPSMQSHLLSKYLFGEICSNCKNPQNFQINPVIIPKEMNVKKSSPIFQLHWLPNFIFTSYEFYEVIFKPLNVKFREVMIGRKNKSNNIVQLDIPYASGNLLFAASKFGEKIDCSRMGIAHKHAVNYNPCEYCGRFMYSNKIVDFFPPFEKTEQADIVLTNEWFTNFHHIVVTRKCAEHLVENQVCTWESQSLIPVKLIE